MFEEMTTKWERKCQWNLKGQLIYNMWVMNNQQMILWRTVNLQKTTILYKILTLEDLKIHKGFLP